MKGASTRYQPGRRDWVKVNCVGVAVFDDLTCGHTTSSAMVRAVLGCERHLSGTLRTMLLSGAQSRVHRPVHERTAHSPRDRRPRRDVAVGRRGQSTVQRQPAAHGEAMAAVAALRNDISRRRSPSGSTPAATSSSCRSATSSTMTPPGPAWENVSHLSNWPVGPPHRLSNCPRGGCNV